MLIPTLAKRDGAFRLNAWGRVDRQGEVTGKAEHLLEDVGLIDKKNVKADYLSRGDKRRLELDARLDVVERFVEHAQRILLGLRFDGVERAIDDAFGDGFLAVQHHRIHEFRQNLITKLGIRQDFPLFGTTTTRHINLFLLTVLLQKQEPRAKT